MLGLFENKKTTGTDILVIKEIRRILQRTDGCDFLIDVLRGYDSNSGTDILKLLKDFDNCSIRQFCDKADINLSPQQILSFLCEMDILVKFAGPKYDGHIIHPDAIAFFQKYFVKGSGNVRSDEGKKTFLLYLTPEGQLWLYNLLLTNNKI
jgi:hypothetical protein